MKMQQFYLSEGPAIDVLVESVKGEIVKVGLSLGKSRGMTFTFTENNPGLYSQIQRWAEGYVKGENRALPKLKIEHFGPFANQVIQAIAEMPIGSVMTYGELAALLGNPQASRAVGNACGRNQHLLFIPCHRIVAKGGRLGGFSGGDLEIKRRLLAFEASKNK